MAQLDTQPVVIDLNQPVRVPFGAERRIPLVNMIVTRDGGRKQRGGFTRHMASAISGTPVIRGLHDFIIGDTQDVVVSAGGKIWKEDSLDGTFDDITQSGLSWSSKELTSAIQMNDILGIWNKNGDAAQKYDQGAVTTDLGATNATTAKFVTQYRGVGFASGVSGAPDTLYHSSVGDIDAAFTAFVVGLKDGLGGITGIIGHPNPNLNLFFVFKSRGIYAIDMPLISDASGWIVKQLTGLEMKLGAFSHHTIKNVPVDGGPDIWFQGNDGSIYSLNRLVETEDAEMSNLTEPYQTSFDDIKKDRLSNAVADVDTEGQQYCLFSSPSSVDVNDRMYTVSYRMMGPVGRNPRPKPECQIHDGFGAASVGRIQISNRQRLVTGDYDGFLNRQFSNNIDDPGSTAISPSLQLFNLDAGLPQIQKAWQKATIHLRPEADTDLNFAWVVDGGAEQTELIDQLGSSVPLDTFLLDTDSLAEKNIVLVSHAPLRGENNGYHLSFTLGNTAAGQGMEVYRIIFQIKDSGS